MVGIYYDSFIGFLKSIFDPKDVKLNKKNIIVPCPWCEINRKKRHYHFWISLELPIFHCFHSGCPKKSGMVSDFIKKINGIDISNLYINSDLLDQKIIESRKEDKLERINIPELNESKFKLKSLYVKKRLGFNVDLKSINGMIFDVYEFMEMNKKIIFDKSMVRLKDYLQSNFVGFITKDAGIIFFRNIDINSSFRHFKIKLQESKFVDYYSLKGLDFNSNHVILAEGVFDIWSEYIFDVLKLKNKTKLYASALSSNYKSLIKSIVYNEDIYQLDISILSDNNIPIEYYINLKKFNSYIINSLTVYYNKGGKDFNDFPLIVERFVI